MRPVRLGVLSLAHVHADGYLAILADLDGVELVGLWDEDPGRGEAAATQHGTSWFSSAEALLETGLEGVVITSVNSQHRQFTELAAAAGVHVLSEKPLATRLEDGRAMLDACQRGHVRLMTAFPMRFSAPLRVLSAMVGDGRLGEVVCCEGVNTGEMPNVHRAWFVDPELCGGGALMDHVVHLADLFRWIFGSEVTEVYATANHVLQEGYEGVETGGLLSLGFESGVFATIDCSWSKPRSYPTWGGLSVEVVGTRGVLVADAFAQRLELYGRQRDDIRWPFWGSDANRAMLAEFAAAIRDNREPAVTGLDGYRALEVVDAAYRSVASGEPVRLPLSDGARAPTAPARPAAAAQAPPRVG